jgi:hypothetical protein
MQLLEVSCAVCHIYIYVVSRLRVKLYLLPIQSIHLRPLPSAPWGGRVGRPSRRVGLSYNVEVCLLRRSVVTEIHCTCTLVRPCPLKCEPCIINIKE